MGDVKPGQYGPELLEVIHAYAERNDIPPGLATSTWGSRRKEWGLGHASPNFPEIRFLLKPSDLIRAATQTAPKGCQPTPFDAGHRLYFSPY